MKEEDLEYYSKYFYILLKDWRNQDLNYPHLVEGGDLLASIPIGIDVTNLTGWYPPLLLSLVVFLI